MLVQRMKTILEAGSPKVSSAMIFEDFGASNMVLHCEEAPTE